MTIHPPILHHPVATMVTNSLRALTVKMQQKKRIMIINEPVVTDIILYYI